MTRRLFLLVTCFPLALFLGCGSSESLFQEYECFCCQGAGTSRCTICFGQGVTTSFESITQGGSSQICGNCGGTGNMPCACCKGKGKLSNNPPWVIDSKDVVTPWPKQIESI